MIVTISNIVFSWSKNIKNFRASLRLRAFVAKNIKLLRATLRLRVFVAKKSCFFF
jgi:hypothetical protein